GRERAERAVQLAQHGQFLATGGAGGEVDVGRSARGRVECVVEVEIERLSAEMAHARASSDWRRSRRARKRWLFTSLSGMASVAFAAMRVIQGPNGRRWSKEASAW